VFEQCADGSAIGFLQQRLRTTAVAAQHRALAKPSPEQLLQVLLYFACSRDAGDPAEPTRLLAHDAEGKPESH
jgi:hypothetical protein